MNEKKKKKLISMKFKLLAIIIPVVVAITALLVMFSYYISRTLLENSSYETLEISVSKQATQIEAWLDENLASFKTAKQTITSVAKPGKTIMWGDTAKGKLNSRIKRIGRTDRVV